MTEAQHAFLPPSGASIWGPGGCAYYPTMAAAYATDEDSPEAREGTAAHHYLAERLKGNPCAVGDLAPNGQVITEEMAECTQGALDWVAKMRTNLDRPDCVETRLYMPSIHPTLNWGTADWFGVNLEQKTIYLLDYKHGHRYVDPWENWQEVDYGVGVARAFSVIITPEWKFVFAIAQPRCYHPDGPLKTWECDGARFMELADSLAYAARKATEPDATMSTGDHCRDCEGRYACPAFQQVAGAGLDLSLRSVPQEMPAEAVGTARTMIATAIKRLEGMATGLDAQINALTRAGKSVPGWELKPTEGRIAWTKPIEEVYAIGDLCGVELRKPEALTPTQAMNKGIDATVISLYSERKAGALKVAPSDKTAASKAFK